MFSGYEEFILFVKVSGCYSGVLVSSNGSIWKLVRNVDFRVDLLIWLF